MEAVKTQTTHQWWASVKRDPAKLHDWLRRQYRGEKLAARRIADLAKQLQGAECHNDILTIAQDEARHAVWIGELLDARGVSKDDDAANASNRYWSAVNPAIASMDDTMAAGAHAEAMRLVRIEEIAFDNDPALAPDIRTAFFKIWVDESRHVATFQRYASHEAMSKMEPHHQAGLQLLGLEI